VTRAKSVAGGYRLNGAKMWITNAPIADVFVVGPRPKTAIHASSRKRHGGAAGEGRGQVRLRPATGEIVMDEVFVPEENLLPGVSGLRQARSHAQQRTLRHRLGCSAPPNSAGTRRAAARSSGSSSAALAANQLIRKSL
jgi:glutaryl-CoA dehydrogenase